MRFVDQKVNAGKSKVMVLEGETGLECEANEPFGRLLDPHGTYGGPTLKLHINNNGNNLGD